MTPPAPLVHIVDDDDSFRRSVARLLRVCGHQVETYVSAEDFLERMRPGPGCVLLDVHMPGPDGLELQALLQQRPDAPPIVFLTGHGDVPMSVLAIKAGAEDFLMKPVCRDQLLDAVQRAIARDAAARAGREFTAQLRSRYERLTPAEKRIFAMVVTGMLNKQIAFDLGRTERTVKAHRAQVMHKMEAQSLAELVRMADELGISAARR